MIPANRESVPAPLCPALPKNLFVDFQIRVGGLPDVEIFSATRTRVGDPGIMFLVVHQTEHGLRERVFVSLREKDSRASDHFRQPGNVRRDDGLARREPFRRS